MSNTFVLECNRFNSKSKDNQDKLDWINNIDPLHLKEGDQVTMVKAILNRRGASTQTVEFENDMEEEILIAYYVMDSGIGASCKARPWVYVDGKFTDGTTTRVTNSGFTDTPYLRCKASSDGLGRKIYPIISKVSIKIPKGSYSVSNLADLITQQFSNGVFDTPFDYKINNTLKQNLLTYGLPYNGGFMDRVYHTGPLNNSGIDDAEIEFNIGLQTTGGYWDDYIKDYDDLTLLGDTADTIRDKTDPDPAHFFRGNDPALADSFSSLGSSFIGASPSISWDTNENRFFLNELHSPYTIPTIDQPDTITTANANAGSTATIFKEQHDTFNPDVSCNPRCAVTGVWILNPAFRTSRLKGDIQYTKDIAVASAGNLSHVINVALESVAPYNPTIISEGEKATAFWVGTYGADFDECFSSTQLAETEWKTTLWYRLGFDRTQFGVKNRFTYKYQTKPTETITTRGITTTNDYDISYALSMSGLGPHPFSQHGTVVHAYAGEIPTSLTGAEAGIYSEARIETPTKPLVAQHLPQLSSQNSYYNVWSDLVPNNWFSNEGNKMSLVGNISLNYSDGDFVYSFDDNIVFTLTEDMVVNSVNTKIVQSDGTIPDQAFFDPYTAIFYKVVRPTRSFTSNVATIEQKA